MLYRLHCFTSLDSLPALSSVEAVGATAWVAALGDVVELVAVLWDTEGNIAGTVSEHHHCMAWVASKRLFTL